MFPDAPGPVPAANEHPSADAARRFLADLSAGPLVGAGTALVEFTIHWLRNVPFLHASLLPGMIILYVIYWSATGTLLAVILAMLRRLNPRLASDRRSAFAWLCALALSLSLHAAATTHLLVDVGRPWSTLLFGLALLLVPGLYALIRPILGGERWHRPRRRLLLASSIVLLSLPLQLLGEQPRGVGDPGSSAAARGPSIILIVLDTLRCDHVGAYGYPLNATPNLDRIAREGVLFERAYAPSSWTLPSTASLLTSRSPRSHRVTTYASGLSAKVESIPKILQELGYRTGLFSGNPFIAPAFGFDGGFTHVYAPSPSIYYRTFYIRAYLRRTYGRFPLFPRGSDALLFDYESLWRPAIRRGWTAGDDVCDALFRWLDECPEPTPIFAHVQLIEPHSPYAGTGRFGPPGLSDPPSMGARTPLYPFNTTPRPSAEKLATLVGRYDDDVWEADRSLGRIIDKLEQSGRLEDTWLVITADHGEEFWDHEGWGHGNSLFDELIRVPLVFRGPGAARRRIQSMARLIDVAPTLAVLAGSAPPPAFIGTSLLAVLLGETDDTGVTKAFAEVHQAPGRQASALLRSDGSKLIRARVGFREELMLFDRSVDPAERRNLAPLDAPRLDALLAALKRSEARAGSTDVEETVPTIDPETERQLRAVGYLD